jgi:hypothetical protein
MDPLPRVELLGIMSEHSLMINPSSKYCQARGSVRRPIAKQLRQCDAAASPLAPNLLQVHRDYSVFGKWISALSG